MTTYIEVVAEAEQVFYEDITAAFNLYSFIHPDIRARIVDFYEDKGISFSNDFAEYFGMSIEELASTLTPREQVPEITSWSNVSVHGDDEYYPPDFDTDEEVTGFTNIHNTELMEDSSLSDTEPYIPQSPVIIIIIQLVQLADSLKVKVRSCKILFKRHVTYCGWNSYSSDRAS